MIPSRFKAVLIATKFLLLTLPIGSIGSISAQSSDRQTVVRPGPRTGPVWLGVMLKKGDGDKPGVEVSATLRRSPSDGTGIEVGDVILTIDGTEVSSVRGVQRVVRSKQKGDVVQVQTRRGQELRTLAFTLQEMPGNEEIVKRHLVGYPAPDFTFEYAGDGKKQKLSALKGKPTIIDFWATWCTPCHKTQAELAAVKKNFGDAIHLVGVSSESQSKIRAHLEKYPAHYAMARDVEEAGHAGFVVSSFPTMIILDSDHKVAAVVFGAGNKELIAKKVKNLLQ